MKSQVAKRVNVNLTEENVKKIELIQKWYKTIGGEKDLKQSDIIRDAIELYFFNIDSILKTHGQKIAKLMIEKKPIYTKDLKPEDVDEEYLKYFDDDLPF